MENGTIMIVEDDDNDLLLIQRSLHKARIDNLIIVARDGVEALEFLLDGAPPLACLPMVVLLDIKLPRMDGLEVLQRLRSESRTRSLPVVLLTSSDEQEDLVRGYQFGVNSYVRKPIEFRHFQETVATLGLYWTLINRFPHEA
jgi:two-component system response regulator